MKSLHRSKQIPQLEINEYLSTLESSPSSERGKIMKEIIRQCYNNKANQFYLCNNMNVPYNDGPLSLNPIPQYFKGKEVQLIKLFSFLNKVKESYICWLIYEDAELGILNLKLITSFELQELDIELDYTLIGIFIGNQYFPKTRTNSTKAITQKSLHSSLSSTGLSSKTTKESFSTSGGTNSNKKMQKMSNNCIDFAKSSYGSIESSKFSNHSAIFSKDRKTIKKEDSFKTLTNFYEGQSHKKNVCSEGYVKINTLSKTLSEMEIKRKSCMLKNKKLEKK